MGFVCCSFVWRVILLTWSWTPLHNCRCWCRSFLCYFGGSIGSGSRCSTTRTYLPFRRTLNIWRCRTNRLRSVSCCWWFSEGKCMEISDIEHDPRAHSLTYSVLLSSSASFVAIPFVGCHAVTRCSFSGCHVVNCSFHLLLISEWLA